MTLLAVERIKLFTTRSPWWCMLLALVLTVGFAALIAANLPTPTALHPDLTQVGYEFGLVVIMVMAALAVTTEYRTGTIKATFVAVPHRVAALLAKTAVVAVLAGVVGEITAFASWGIAKAISPDSPLALDTAQDWRAVAGVGLVYLVGAVIAVGVGILLRHTAGAVALLLIYVLLVENLVQLIPTIGGDIHQWMPFNVAGNFLTGGAPKSPMGPAIASDSTLSPWLSLAYFAGVAAVILVIALFSAARRDA
jgi:ABC-2 type transport system permease protein